MPPLTSPRLVPLNEGIFQDWAEKALVVQEPPCHANAVTQIVVNQQRSHLLFQCCICT